MITFQKVAVVVVMLPWFWGLFQLLVFRNLFSLIYMMPYLLIIKKSEQEYGRKESKSNNVNFYDLNVTTKKDAGTSTEEVNFDNYVNLAENPFLELIKITGPHGDELSPHDMQTTNPFLGIYENAGFTDAEESLPALLATNPFLAECGNNVDFEDEYEKELFSYDESNAICREWIRKHRTFHLKTVRSFSCF